MGLLNVVAAAVALAVSIASNAAAQPSAPAGVAEEDVKAAFLYNFAKYVSWPPTAASDSFRLCIVAEPGFVKRVDNLIAGETIEGRPVLREVPASAEAARSCNILYVGSGESARGERLIQAVHGAAVLTVADADSRPRDGMITFVRDGDRVRFDVDNSAAQNAGLAISSRLLRLARHVGPQERQQ